VGYIKRSANIPSASIIRHIGPIASPLSRTTRSKTRYKGPNFHCMASQNNSYCISALNYWRASGRWCRICCRRFRRIASDVFSCSFLSSQKKYATRMSLCREGCACRNHLDSADDSTLLPKPGPPITQNRLSSRLLNQFWYSACETNQWQVPSCRFLKRVSL
jgi:hypothetical protein